MTTCAYSYQTTNFHYCDNCTHGEYHVKDRGSNPITKKCDQIHNIAHCYSGPSHDQITFMVGPNEPIKGSHNSANDVRQVSRLADMTLKGVAEHADFLAMIWKITAIFFVVITSIAGFFGIKTFPDIRKHRQDLENLKSEYSKFIEETKSNHLAMMNSTSITTNIDKGASLLIQAQNPSISANKKSGLIDEANGCFKQAQDSCIKIIEENKPTEAGICSWLYNLYGYTQYSLGDYSNALFSFNKSIGYKENPTALYNAACCSARINLSKKKVISLLERAVDLDHRMAKMAKNDSDFDNIKDSIEFINTVGPLESED